MKPPSGTGPSGTKVRNNGQAGSNGQGQVGSTEQYMGIGQPVPLILSHAPLAPLSPADAQARPEHPILGGPLYLAGPLARLDQRQIELVAEFFRYYEQNLPANTTHLRLLLDSAQNMAQNFYDAQLALEQKIAQRRTLRQEAIARLHQEEAAVQQAVEPALKPLQEQRQALEEKLLELEETIQQAEALPGVPIQEEPSVAPETTETKRSRRWWPVPSEVLIAVVGMLYGFSIFVERRLLNLAMSRAFVSQEIPWLVFSCITGTGLALLTHRAVFTLWRGIGELAERRCPTDDLNSVGGELAGRLRLDVQQGGALLLSTLLVATEAVVMRNALVSQGALPDPQSLVHYLSGFVCLLPIAIYGGATGFRQGEKTIRQRRIRAQKRQEQQQTSQTQCESAEAQTAHSLHRYRRRLERWHGELSARIAALYAPHEPLLASLRVAAQTSPEATAEELRILQAAREDAVLAFERFLAEFVTFMNWQEPRPQNLLVQQILTSTIRPAQQPPLPARKPGFWERIKAFFRRLFARRSATAPRRTEREG